MFVLVVFVVPCIIFCFYAVQHASMLLQTLKEKENKKKERKCEALAHLLVYDTCKPCPTYAAACGGSGSGVLKRGVFSFSSKKFYSVT
jgi:hypothetical protein